MTGSPSRWLVPFAVARVAASTLAAALVAFGGIADDERWLLAAALAYGPLSASLAVRRSELRRAPVAWAGDSLAVLALVVASGDWRSPFYLLWLTTLALPAVALPPRGAVVLAVGASVIYLAVAVAGGPVPGTLQPVSSETLAMHVVLPGVLVGALAYAAEVVRRLSIERERRERLVVEAERRRIAWELHDSAKQRLHAAHLIVSSLAPRVGGDLARPVHQAIAELESATSDLDTSLAELRSPLDGRPLADALAARAHEMRIAGGPAVLVTGGAPQLPPLHAAHVFRIATEAITNAIRHADAREIVVELGERDGGFRLSVRDDGKGVPSAMHHRGTGLLAMRSRAASIGARFSISQGDVAGTEVVLELPDEPKEGQ